MARRKGRQSIRCKQEPRTGRRPAAAAQALRQGVGQAGQPWADRGAPAWQDRQQRPGPGAAVPPTQAAVLSASATEHRFPKVPAQAAIPAQHAAEGPRVSFPAAMQDSLQHLPFSIQCHVNGLIPDIRVATLCLLMGTMQHSCDDEDPCMLRLLFTVFVEVFVHSRQSR